MRLEQRALDREPLRSSDDGNAGAELAWNFQQFFFVCLFFETEFLCEALTVLELSVETRQALNSEISLFLPPKC